MPSAPNSQFQRGESRRDFKLSARFQLDDFGVIRTAARDLVRFYAFARLWLHLDESLALDYAKACIAADRPSARELFAKPTLPAPLASRIQPQARALLSTTRALGRLSLREFDSAGLKPIDPNVTDKGIYGHLFEYGDGGEAFLSGI